MDVTFTTEPLTAFSSFINPRANMIGAKKFTWNTWRHTSAVVSSEPSRLPPPPLGDIAALVRPGRTKTPLERVAPHVGGGTGRAEPLAAVALGRDRRIVHQRVQLVALDPPPDLLDGRKGVGFVRQIDLDVILGSGLPRAVLRERMARAGDHAPAGGREALDGGVADAAACSGEQQGAARLVR